MKHDGIGTIIIRFIVTTGVVVVIATVLVGFNGRSVYTSLCRKIVLHFLAQRRVPTILNGRVRAVCVSYYKDNRVSCTKYADSYTSNSSKETHRSGRNLVSSDHLWLPNVA